MGGVVESDMYTWGLSAQGQLGNFEVKNSYNISRPTKVEFLGAESTKIAFVSAAAKHNLCVDTDGALWYFGEKQSVGIKDKKDKYQFAPTQLRATLDPRRPYMETAFRAVAAGVDNNVVVTKRQGHVF